MASLAMNAHKETDRRRDERTDRQRRLRSRNIAIAAILGALVLLFYIVTIVKMSGS